MILEHYCHVNIHVHVHVHLGTHVHVYTCMYIYTDTVFPLKGGTMELPHPLVLHKRFTLKNTVL